MTPTSPRRSSALATRLATIAAGTAVCLSLLIAPAATAAPTPDPTASATATPTTEVTTDPSSSPELTAEPTPTDTASPAPAPDGTPSPSASATPDPSATPMPSPSGSLAATQAAAAYSALTVEALAAVVGFQAGNIVSDAVFTNKNTMTASSIDAFFRQMVSSCQSGYTCLKDYRQNTPNRAADSYCSGYQGGANESAATIIYKVAQSCNINPQVIIVMLQKEQGLITHTWPSQWRYDMALGQGCPDTAPCDPAFAGFFYQIYGAARQMNIYMEGRYFTYYPVGRTSNIYWHPNASCGTGPVYISNKSTAALYYYTPYQPNAAALAAGFGEGDGCSAYGNRNFYNYFKLWFGDPTSGGGAAPSAINTYWNANGGAAGWIGAATGSVQSWGSSGTSQTFQNADLYANANNDVYAVTGAIRTEYRLVGGPASGLGWPMSSQFSENGGAYQEFARGRIYQRPDGRAYAIGVPIYNAYVDARGTGGSLGWPTNRAGAVAGGSIQTFDRGKIYQSPTGTFGLSQEWASYYDKSGGLAGSLGTPTTGQIAVDTTTVRVKFTRAWVYRTGKTMIPVFDGWLDAFRADGDEKIFGKPTAAATSLNGGARMTFSKGEIYTSPAGTYSVTTLSAALKSAGGVTRAGFPVAATRSAGGSASQNFANMTLTRTAAGKTAVVRGALGAQYRSLGAVSSSLRAATGAERVVGTGALQDFEGGRLVATPTFMTTMTSGTARVWDRLGGPSGRLGWPILSAYSVAGVSVQEFSGGIVMDSPGSGAHAMYGVTVRTYREAGGTPVLGAPAEDELVTARGPMQLFENGTIFVPLRGTASALTGTAYSVYSTVGGLQTFGYPLSPAIAVGGGSVIPFDSGSIATSNSGTFAVRGAMRFAHDTADAYVGPLGFPVANERSVAGGAMQSFAGGTAYVSSRALAVTRGALNAEYLRRGGPSGPLGWPVSNEVSVNGGAEQRFEKGTLVLHANGTYSVR